MLNSDPLISSAVPLLDLGETFKIETFSAFDRGGLGQPRRGP